MTPKIENYGTATRAPLARRPRLGRLLAATALIGAGAVGACDDPNAREFLDEDDREDGCSILEDYVTIHDGVGFTGDSQAIPLDTKVRLADEGWKNRIDSISTDESMYAITLWDSSDCSDDEKKITIAGSYENLHKWKNKADCIEVTSYSGNVAYIHDHSDLGTQGTWWALPETGGYVWLGNYDLVNQIASIEVEPGLVVELIDGGTPSDPGRTRGYLEGEHRSLADGHWTDKADYIKVIPFLPGQVRIHDSTDFKGNNKTIPLSKKVKLSDEGWVNRIDSISTDGTMYEITLWDSSSCSDDERKITIAGSHPNLHQWKNKADCIRVDPYFGNVAYIHDHSDLGTQGTWWAIPETDGYVWLKHYHLVNQIASMKVESGMLVDLIDGGNPSNPGRTRTYSAGEHRSMADGHWTDKADYFRIRTTASPY